MWEKIKHSIWANTALLVFLVLVGAGSYTAVRRAVLFSQEADATQKRVDELKNKKQELEARIQELEDPRAVEREAKERFNLKKQGETVVVVLPEPFPKPVEEKKGFWAMMRDRVKKFLKR